MIVEDARIHPNAALLIHELTEPFPLARGAGPSLESYGARVSDFEHKGHILYQPQG